MFPGNSDARRCNGWYNKSANAANFYSLQGAYWDIYVLPSDSCIANKLGTDGKGRINMAVIN